MFHYYTPPADFGCDREVHIAALPSGLSGVKALVTALGAALRFPPYSGKNFDALWDGLRDLDLPCRRVVVVHQDLPDLDDAERRTYVEMLRDAVAYWRDEREEGWFEVWFREVDRAAVEEALV